MRNTLCCILLLLLPLTAICEPLGEKRQNIFNLDTAGVAISGYDPVNYFQGKAMKGEKEISFVYKGITYLFSSEQNILSFKKNPPKYEPAYGGWCAWAMLEGEKIEINPKRYKIIDGRLYLFYDRFFTNTLKKWNKLTEKKTEASLIEKADSHWLKFTNEFPSD